MPQDLTPPWATDPASPRRGSFILGPELGRGGMGRVHEAWDPVLRRRLALKLVLLQDPTLRDPLAQEAQRQARVDHPNVCKVYEVGDEAGHPYIALQLIQGKPLDEAQPPPTPREAAWIMACVAGALHAAHRQGLIHRDIKPSNIVLEVQADGSRKPYLVDFGLALDRTSEACTTQSAAGTPAFMSPEQARGEPLHPRSDIYSLGATFHSLFCGEAPRRPAPRTEGVRGAPPPARGPLAHLPGELADIILKCLEADPAQRYETAFALEEDLRRWLAGEPIRARPVGRTARAWRFLRRHQPLSLTLGAGLLVVGSLATWQAAQRAEATERIELTQRFSMEIREAEELIRVERMLPPHDIRSAESRLRHRMEAIRAAMRGGSGAMRGPACYALGRGHLLLREHDQARTLFLEAWEAGQQTPETAYALGQACTTLLMTRKPGMTPEARAAEARSWLARSEGQSLDPESARRALMAFAAGDMASCRRFCLEHLKERPWHHETRFLEAATLGLFLDGAMPGPELLGILREAAQVAPSDGVPILLELHLLLKAPSPPDPARIRQLVDTLRRIRPDEADQMARRMGLQTP